jgi:cardiolipin synthase A/B
MLLADGLKAIVGSINLTPGSFDSRRELAIEVHDDEVVDRLHDIVHQDWENSRPLDLTDEGLLADLQDEEEAQNLGLSASRGGHDKKSRKPPARIYEACFPERSLSSGEAG